MAQARAKSSPRKTPSDSPPTRPGKHGGTLRTGNPGNKGGGRPPGPFKDFLARMRQDPVFQESLEAALKDPYCKGFPAALKTLTDYDDEKPAEKRQIVGPVEVRVKIAREGRRVTAS